MSVEPDNTVPERKLGISKSEFFMKVQSSVVNGNDSINTTKSIWMKEELIYSLVTPAVIDHHILGDNFEILSGELPTNPNAIMLNHFYPSVLEGNTPSSVGTDTGTYTISGIYNYEVDQIPYRLSNIVVSSLEYMKPKYFRYTTFRYNDFELLVYANDIERAERALNEAGYETSSNIYNPAKARQVKLEEFRVVYLIGLSGLIISAISIFLVIRSELISRMYEIIVFRSIGISRKEIKRLFLVEIGITTSLSTLLGFVISVVLLTRLQASLPSLNIVYYSLFWVSISIVGLYLTNLIFGMIPIILALQKTPTELMKHHDL